MNVALVVIYVLTFISLLNAANGHGKPRDNHNFWQMVFAWFLQLILVWWAVGWKFI